MEEELIVSKDELVTMFANDVIKDSNTGWLYNNEFVINIIALHEKDPKYIYDVTNAEYYKIVPIKTV
jgi:hypothetical protein